MANLVQRAHAYAPLAPWERALLRLIEAWTAAGLVVALPVVIVAIKTGNFNWQAIAGAFAVGFLLAAYKYVSARNDPPLPTSTPSTG